MAIRLREYDEAWPRQAEATRQELVAVLPAGVLDVIEHVGSTSVPGLAAKPIIDLMASTSDLELVLAHVAALETVGFHRLDTPMPNRLFFVRDDDGGQRSHHLHVVPADTWDTRNERLFRDHLREHPEDARRYAALKWALVTEHADPDAYTVAKTDLIQEVTDRARAARGLPSVPVWEE